MSNYFHDTFRKRYLGDEMMTTIENARIFNGSSAEEQIQ